MLRTFRQVRQVAAWGQSLPSPDASCFESCPYNIGITGIPQALNSVWLMPLSGLLAVYLFSRL